MEAHWELLSGRETSFLLDTPTVAHPDDVGESALEAKWNVHTIALTSSASIPVLDFPPWIAEKFIISERIFRLTLDLFHDCIVLGNRVVGYDMLRSLNRSLNRQATHRLPLRP
jgi:hypothetical protein